VQVKIIQRRANRDPPLRCTPIESATSDVETVVLRLEMARSVNKRRNNSGAASNSAPLPWVQKVFRAAGELASGESSAVALERTASASRIRHPNFVVASRIGVGLK